MTKRRKKHIVTVSLTPVEVSRLQYAAFDMHTLRSISDKISQAIDDNKARERQLKDE